MIHALALILRHPTLRLIALTMTLIGAINASVFPYQSLIAIDRIGIAQSAYALVLLCASVLAVTSSVAAGIITDQRANRRTIAIVTAAMTVLGPLLMLVFPGRLSLVLCHGILIPLSASLYGQCFALARLVTLDRPAERDAILSALRALLSLTFLVVLPVWSLAFAKGVDVMAIYGLALAAGLTLLALTALFWPRDGQTHWADPPSGLSLAQSLREIGETRVLSRIAFLGAITAAPALYMVLISLVFEHTPGRSTSDVALFVALVAGFEVPFMLVIPRLLRQFGRSTLIAAGGLIYATYLILMPGLAPYAVVWLLPVLAGLGGAAILTLPIAYFQDLMAGRPGAGSSLLALQKVTSDTLCAAAFASGTALSGYGLAALFGGIIAASGVGLLLVADRSRVQAA